MSNELIERIDKRNQAWVSDGMKDKIMTDCKAEIEQARKTSEYWKAEHLAGNAEIERLTKALEAKPSIDALIDEIKKLLIPNNITHQIIIHRSNLEAILDKWRTK